MEAPRRYFLHRIAEIRCEDDSMKLFTMTHHHPVKKKRERWRVSNMPKKNFEDNINRNVVYMYLLVNLDLKTVSYNLYP